MQFFMLCGHSLLWLLKIRRNIPVSLFNQDFIKTGIISEVSFKSIQLLMDLRHEADYQDFSEINEDEAQEAVRSAKIIITTLDEALKKLLESAEIQKT